MDSKLIMFEGIPGSGKTTFAKKASEFMSKYIPTNLYIEGMMHPADLAWCACIPLGVANQVLAKFPQYDGAIRANTYIENGYAIVAYTQIQEADGHLDELFRYMENYEVYDGRVSFSTFSKLHMTKWKYFCKQASLKDELNIFESCFLQNHVNELMLFHDKKEIEIIDYMLTLMETVMPLYPMIIYLEQPDVERTLTKVAMQRTDTLGRQDWLARVTNYLETSPYGKAKGLQGFNGVVDYFKRRKNLEMKILDLLPIESVVFHNPNYLWDNLWEEIKVKLEITYLDLMNLRL